MAVIIREKRSIAGKEQIVKVYQRSSEDLLSKQEREQADELDLFLEQRMQAIEQKLQKMGLLDLKGKRGVLRLWFELGKQLGKFVERSNLVSAEDRKFIWRALYDHAGKLAPNPPYQGSNPPQNRRADDPRNHFRYCFLLAKKFPDFKFVENVGDWSSWIDLLDSPTIRNDERILEWIASKQQSSTEDSRVDWLRKIINGIRREFPAAGAMTDTSVLSNKELKEKLEKMYRSVFPRANRA
jgi:hypothetical protein